MRRVHYYLLVACVLALTAMACQTTSSEVNAAPAAAKVPAQTKTAAAGQSAHPLPGIEVLMRYYSARLKGKRVAILTNPTGVDLNLVSTIDRIRALPGVTVVRLFAPEHGLRGGFAAGESVDDARDPVSGLPVVSLHGKTRRPSAESLRDVDVVVYDIQDIGARSYTFISSLTYMMEACEQAGVEVLVLDRPDPLGGAKTGGPGLDAANISFIGIHRVPAVYGLTPGEWARLIQRERTPRLKLTVIPMSGWRRGMTYGQLGWAWVPPSEHIPRWESSLFYSMTGDLGELGTLSNGVGTPLPFEQVGAPGLNAARLAGLLETEKMPGVRFRATTFKPRYGAFVGSFCQGVQIHLTDARACDPARVALALMRALNEVASERNLFSARPKSEDYQMFLKAVGSSALANALAAQADLAPITAQLEQERTAWLARRAPVLIYP
jgi:uncharacterized protein YbbC (DUF1343 family)